MDYQALINLEVYHSLFGKGTIIDADEELHFTVRFENDPDKVRRFSFPGAFADHFLEFVRPEYQAIIAEMPQLEQPTETIDYYAIVFNGDLYTRNSSSYWTLNNEVVHDTLQRALNAELERCYPIDTLDIIHILWTADELLLTNQFGSARRYYEAALARNEISLGDIRYTLARLSSCYRKLGMPYQSIDLLGRYAQPRYESPAFMTSIGAAYMDVDNIEAAKHFAGIAYRMLNRRTDEKLHALYRRINAAAQ